MVLIFVKLARRQLRKLDCLMKHNEVMKNSQFRFFLCRNKLSHFLWLCHFLSSAIAKVIQLGVIQCIIHYLSPKFRVGQGFWVFGIQGRFKSGIRYIAA